MWNPNVALELGLADGVGAEYYILVNRKLSNGVPSDIQGMQRIEYSNFDNFDETNGLFQNIVNYLVKDETYPRKMYDEIDSGKNKIKKYYFALRVLAHFKESKRLREDELKILAKGTYLRSDEIDKILNMMVDLGLLANLDSRRGMTLKKNLYRSE